MAKPLNADWPLAMTLYAQGVPYAAIAERVGVTQASLRQRAHRYGWRALRDTSLATVSQVVTKTLMERARDVRDMLGVEVERQALVLGREPPTHCAELRSGPEGQGRAATVETVLKSAERVFGWEREGGSNMLNLGLSLMIGAVPSVAHDAALDEADVHVANNADASALLPPVEAATRGS